MSETADARRRPNPTAPGGDAVADEEAAAAATAGTVASAATSPPTTPTPPPPPPSSPPPPSGAAGAPASSPPLLVQFRAETPPVGSQQPQQRRRELPPPNRGRRSPSAKAASPASSPVVAGGGSPGLPRVPSPDVKTPSRASPASSAGSPPESGVLPELPAHRRPLGPGGGGGPIPFRGVAAGGGPIPFRGGAGAASSAARRPAPLALHELTPVIRNTSEDDAAFFDDGLAPVVSPDGAGEGGEDGGGEDAARRRREEFLSLSVPDGGGCDRVGGGGGAGGGGLQQRPRRPLPQASPDGGRRALRLDVPIPPRASTCGIGSSMSSRSSGSSSSGAPVTPFLRVEGGPGESGDSGESGGSPPRAEMLPVPPPAVRSHSAGNLDMHSMVKTIREHLARQKEGDEGYDDSEDEMCDDDDDDGDERAPRRGEKGPMRLSFNANANANSEFRRDAEAAAQAGLPPPSILHPQLPRHDPELAEPYRPVRENSFEVGVRRVGADELSSIFQRGPTPRSANSANGGAGAGDGRPPLKAPGSPSRHLHLPVPLEERDWSIPSIRLANRVRGSGTSFTSYTCSEDDYTEEDNIIYRDNYEDDEATISTAGSIEAPHHHLEDIGHVERTREPTAPNQGDDVAAAGGATTPPEDLADSAVVALSLSALSCDLAEDLAEAAAAAAVPPEEPAQGDRPAPPVTAAAAEEFPAADRSSRRHKKKKRPKKGGGGGGGTKAEKEREAIEWLRTVEVGGISEAASSKFLTGANRAKAEAAPGAPPGGVLKPHPLNRVISSPPKACVSKESGA